MSKQFYIKLFKTVQFRISTQFKYKYSLIVKNVKLNTISVKLSVHAYLDSYNFSSVVTLNVNYLVLPFIYLLRINSVNKLTLKFKADEKPFK